MLDKLRNVFSRGSATPSSHAGSFAPTHPLYVIGDVHGCLAELDDMLARIETHSEANGVANSKLILLGDYVDRGPKTAQVLERIYTLQAKQPDRVICLMGNHEKMMLEFIDDPAGKGIRWLQFGGSDTLESYGISNPGRKADVEDLTEASMDFEEAMPEGLQSWLRSLPLSFQSGNIVCVHAAMAPDTPPNEQSDRVMLWGHRDFMNTARGDEFWIAHGHTIVKSASCKNSRIALDTGAYQSGRLSAAAISNGHCAFL